MRADDGLHLCEKALDTPTARQGFPWRAFFLTVPFQATVKSLSVERPIDAGAAQVRRRHDLAHGLPLFLERLHARRSKP